MKLGKSGPGSGVHTDYRSSSLCRKKRKVGNDLSTGKCKSI